MTSNNNYDLTGLPPDTDIEEIENHMASVIDGIQKAEYRTNNVINGIKGHGNKYFQSTNPSIFDNIDHHKAVEIMLNQIKHMGSYKLFKKIDKCLKEPVFDRMFLREQRKLFKWRGQFIEKAFNGNSYASWNDFRSSMAFHNNIESSTTLQLLRNFDVIIALSTTNFCRSQPELYFYSFALSVDAIYRCWFEYAFIEEQVDLSGDNIEEYFNDYTSFMKIAELIHSSCHKLH